MILWIFAVASLAAALATAALLSRRTPYRPVVVALVWGLVVDLAVPRDVEAEAAQMDDVFLYTVDDLAQVVESGLESRQAAVVEAEEPAQAE